MQASLAARAYDAEDTNFGYKNMLKFHFLFKFTPTDRQDLDVEMDPTFFFPGTQHEDRLELQIAPSQAVSELRIA